MYQKKKRKRNKGFHLRELSHYSRSMLSLEVHFSHWVFWGGHRVPCPKFLWTIHEDVVERWREGAWYTCIVTKYHDDTD